MTLHDAIEKLLQQTGRPMTTIEIATGLNAKQWYSKKDHSLINSYQIHGRTKSYPQLFNRHGSIVSLAGKKIPALVKVKSSVKSARRAPTPRKNDENYVIDLCDKVLKQRASRQRRFAFLTGDPNGKGFAAKLPVDAYYDKLKLVIEFRERQHTESVTFFDKPDKMTVSGIAANNEKCTMNAGGS